MHLKLYSELYSKGGFPLWISDEVATIETDTFLRDFPPVFPDESRDNSITKTTHFPILCQAITSS
jgi:hypothetical protein